MYRIKHSLKWRFIKIALLAIFCIMIFASLAAAAQGATAAAQARGAAAEQQREQLGAGGPGSDLRRISSPRTQPQTFTGFPAGTLPGDAGSGGGNEELLPKVAMSGDPLSPVIGPEMVGAKLDRLCVIAGHVGYSIVRLGYSPNVMDTPYSFALMNGNRRISTLYFNRSMSLMVIQ